MSERLDKARADVEEARQALNTTKWWQLSKRARASEEFKVRLITAATAESLDRRAAERDAAEREMIRWVERLLEFEQHGGADPEIAEMTVEEIAVKLLILGRRGN